MTPETCRVEIAYVDGPCSSHTAVLANASRWSEWLSVDGRVLWIQPQAEEITGYGLDELLASGRPGLAFSAESQARLAELLDEPHPTSWTIDATLVRKDGSTTAATCTVESVTSAAGEAIGQLLTVMVGQRDEAQFLRSVIDIDPNFIFVKDRAGRFVLCNQALADAYGTTPANMQGRTDSDFTNQAEADHFHNHDLQVIEQAREVVIPEEVITDSRGNTRWLMTVKRPMLNADGRANYLLGVATDITARKLAEAERHDLDKKLRETQQLESLGLLASGIAHDFNNLLTVIQGNTSLAMRRCEPGSKALPLLEQATSAANRAAELCRQLMVYAGRGHSEPADADLSQLVMGTAQLLQLPVRERTTLLLELESDLPMVSIDATQIRQVVMNLVMNAAESISTAGGTIRLSTIVTDAPEATVRIPAPTTGEPVGSNQFVMLQVTDDGSGMSEEVMAKIFDPFYSTKDSNRGFGLASVRGIVIAHQGALDVQSVPSLGTTFRLWLPVVRTSLVSRSG